MRGKRTAHVAAEFNRSPDWLRNLERRGVIPPVPRDFAGYRVFSPEDVQRIREIVLARKRG